MSANAIAARVHEEPASLPAEQAVIGVLLSRPELLDSVSQSLSSDDFYADQHRVVYAQMTEMAAAGETADFIAVQDRLQQNKLLDRAGGPAYLGDLVGAAPSGAHMEHYVGMIRDRSTRRKVIEAADGIRVMASKPGDIGKGATLGIEKLFGILRGNVMSSPEPVRELVKQALEELDLRISGKGLSGISTGFPDIDERLQGGPRPGDLFVIAGRPSMGKTAIGTQIALNAALSGHTVMVFTLEMSRQQITERLLAQAGGVNFANIISGRLRDEDYAGMSVAVGKLNDAPLLIDDTGGLTVQDIAARARLQAKSGGLSMIVVDYLQIMGYPGRAPSRNEQLGEMSRQMKALAKELGVVFVLLSQLNRDVEKRADKKPQMSDLRESGAIEQDADVIMMMYRDDYYNEDSEFKGLAEALIRKNRNGEVGSAVLRFEGEKVRFASTRTAWSMSGD